METTNEQTDSDVLVLLVFQIPQNLPCSVTLQPGPEDTGKVTEPPSCETAEHGCRKLAVPKRHTSV